MTENRKYLFRGIWINQCGEKTKEWLEGDLIHDREGNTYIDTAQGRVVPDTVGQYTEQIAIKKVKIFEDDIVEQVFDIGSVLAEKTGYDSFVGVVRHIDGQWVLENEDKSYTIPLYCETNTNEVIGNIFHNPELLKSTNME